MKNVTLAELKAQERFFLLESIGQLSYSYFELHPQMWLAP